MTINTGIPQPVTTGPKKKSAWFWVAIGCGGLMALTCIGAGIIGFLGKQMVDGIEKDAKDPVARETKAKSVLGAKALPEGYYPNFSMSIPMLMDMTIIGDAPPGEDGQTGKIEKGFFYLRMSVKNEEANRQKTKDYFEGKSDDASAVGQGNANVNIEEEYKKGTLTLNGDTVYFSSFRGTMQSNQGKQMGDGPQLTTMIFPDCPDQKMRLGAWFAPDVSPQTPLAEADLTGTPLDGDALEKFLGHFDFCQ